MGSDTQDNENAQPFKVLSLDDGGVCGLSSLLILERIMEEIRDAQSLSEIPKPCEIFDLIGGTGTGGIIAIMLGRLGMTVGDCIETYKEISQTAFAPQRSSWTRFIVGSTSSIFSTVSLEDAIKKAIRDNCPRTECAGRQKTANSTSTSDGCQHENDYFLDQNCIKTVILATTQVNLDASPTLFRTYEATTSWSKCKIWEVARATSAMVNLFNPIKLGRENESFINSSFGYSNPCRVLITEATRLVPDEQAMLILSVGAGLGDVIEVGDSEVSVDRVLKKIATSSKRVADELEKEYTRKHETYHRFNTENGLRGITLSDWVESSTVSAHTKNYLGEKQDAIKKFTKLLIGGFPPASKYPENTKGHTPVYHIPFHENLQFVGRQEVLSKLNDSLFTKPGFQQVALVGLGGMGKTQVALKLAYTVKEQRTDYSIFWLTATNIDVFRNSCKELAEELKLQLANTDDPKTAVKQYLESSSSGQWLLIVDNVDDPSLFETATKEQRISIFLPQSSQGRIIFTTRSNKAAQLAVKQTSHILELEEMSSEDLTALLRNKVEGHDNQWLMQHKSQVDELLVELCYFPLAIAQAADYMAFNKISIADYLELLREPKEGKIELLKHHHTDDAHLDVSQGAVATTWLITFNQIRKASQDAVKLLRFIAYVDPKAIPESMLPSFEAKKKMTDAVGILLAYGFVRRQRTKGLFDMHSLVHLTTQLWCEDLQDSKEQKLAVLEHMTSIFPDDKWESRFLWRQYLPHALHVIEIEKISEEGLALLSLKVGRCLGRDGDTKGSVKLLEGVMQMRNEALGTDHPDCLESHYALGKAYHDDGQIKKAVSLLERVVDVRDKTLAADHRDRLASQNSLASAYGANGQIKKAVLLLESVVEVRDKTLAVDHPDRLLSQNNLANAYRNDGQIKKGLSLLERVVEVRDKTLAADHPDRLFSQNNLALVYSDDGQIKKAVPLLERVVEVQDKTLAADHPDRLSSQNNLALAYLDDGQTKKGASLLERVVEVRDKTLSADHPDRLLSQGNLANAYLDDGQIKKAVSLLERVVEVRDKTLSADHPDRLLSQGNLANAYLDDGQIKKGVSLLERVVEIQDKTLAADHPNRLAFQHYLAQAYLDDGQIKKAVPLLERVVEVRDKTLSADHPDRLRSHRCLARAYRADGQFQKAASML
ncbi:putative acyl transferase acyl hydrolase lysophospholipase [Ceratocystis lukuohia]|uniref:Acyl transferase acyl hydrolase lysophospholipase n=1 Tax=Ceratocystis lukuohia TaxID=2019550 RepID=A0ABR4MHP9_9PEZI